MHSSAPFVQKLCKPRLWTEFSNFAQSTQLKLQPIQTHIQHCQNNDDDSENDDDLWKPIILMDSSAKQTSGMLSF